MMTSKYFIQFTQKSHKMKFQVQIITKTKGIVISRKKGRLWHKSDIKGLFCILMWLTE